MNALRTLLTAFSVDTGQAEAGLKHLDKSVNGVKASLGGIAKQLAGAFAAHKVKEWVAGQIDLGSALNDQAEKLGVSTDALQKFQFAAGLAGVSSEQAATALGFLNRNLGEAIGGSADAAQTFRDMGVDIESVKNGSTDAAALLPTIAKKFEELGSDAERTALAMKVFGKQGASLLPLLKQGSGELQKMAEKYEELGIGIDDSFIKLADEAGDQLDILRLQFRSLGTQLSVAILPTLTNWTVRLQRGMKVVKDLVKETNIAKEAWVLLAAVGTVAAVKTGLAWAKTLGILKPGAGMLKNIFALGELGLIIGAVILLAAAFEDVYTWLTGGESVIGEFLEKTFGLEYTNQLADQLRGVFVQVEQAIESAKEPLGDIFKTVMDLSIAAMPVVLGLFVDIVRVIAAAVTETVSWANALGKIAKLDFKGAGAALSEGDKKIFGEGGIFGPGTKSATLAAFNASTEARIPSGDARNEAALGVRDLHQSNRVHIEVKGGNTNAETGQAVASAWERAQADGLRRAAASAWRGAGDDE